MTPDFQSGVEAACRAMQTHDAIDILAAMWGGKGDAMAALAEHVMRTVRVPTPPPVADPGAVSEGDVDRYAMALVPPPGRDWTGFNNSPLFNAIRGHIVEMIGNSAWDIIHGRHETVAQCILAKLAHEHHLMPYAVAHSVAQATIRAEATPPVDLSALRAAWVPADRVVWDGEGEPGGTGTSDEIILTVEEWETICCLVAEVGNLVDATPAEPAPELSALRAEADRWRDAYHAANVDLLRAQAERVDLSALRVAVERLDRRGSVVDEDDVIHEARKACGFEATPAEPVGAVDRDELHDRGVMDAILAIQGLPLLDRDGRATQALCIAEAKTALARPVPQEPAEPVRCLGRYELASGFTHCVLAAGHDTDHMDARGGMWGRTSDEWGGRHG